MDITNIKILNFRNIDENSLFFSKNINLFYGLNGQGKTNILESIYFCITGKSFRTTNNKDLLKYGRDNTAVRICYNEDDIEKNIAIGYNGLKKNYYYIGKKCDYDEFMGKLTVISFIPEDIDIIIGSPSVRRDYFDYEMSQADYSYYLILKEFNKVLKARNTLLKEKKYKSDVYEIYNKKFLELSAQITYKRIEFLKNLSILVNLNYRKIFDEKSEVEVVYKSFIGNGLRKDENFLEKIDEKYRELREKEHFCGYSLIGPQRDDFIFMLNNKDSKWFSSQGEKKSIIFSIKISEVDIIYKNKKNYPIFIMDDIDSYFDDKRKGALISFFEKKKIQLFISSTQRLDIPSKFFHVKEGKIDEKNIIDKRDS